MEPKYGTLIENNRVLREHGTIEYFCQMSKNPMVRPYTKKRRKWFTEGGFLKVNGWPRIRRINGVAKYFRAMNVENLNEILNERDAVV